MTAADLELVDEEGIDVLYAWTGSRWFRAGEVRWCTYWWGAFFLSNDYGARLEADWQKEHSRKAMSTHLVEHAKANIDQIAEAVRQCDIHRLPEPATRWNRLEVDR